MSGRVMAAQWPVAIDVRTVPTRAIRWCSYRRCRRSLHRRWRRCWRRRDTRKCGGRCLPEVLREVCDHGVDLLRRSRCAADEHVLDDLGPSLRRFTPVFQEPDIVARRAAHLLDGRARWIIGQIHRLRGDGRRHGPTCSTERDRQRHHRCRTKQYGASCHSGPSPQPTFNFKRSVTYLRSLVALSSGVVRDESISIMTHLS